jgi:AraC-like DNA-binding protein
MSVRAKFQSFRAMPRIAKKQPQHTLPAMHLLHLVEVIEPWGVTAKALLPGVDVEALSKADSRVPVSTVVRIIQRARTLTGEPGLGFHLGLKLGIAAHGQLGLAAMTCSTLRDSILLAQMFAPTRTTALSFQLEEDGNEARIVIQEHADLGSARDVLVFALLVSLWKIGNLVTGSEMTGRVDVAFPEPPYFSRFHAGVPGEIHFNRPRHAMRFDRELLDQPLVTADRAASAVARQELERQLALIGPPTDVLERVKQFLGDTGGGYRSIAGVAKLMHVSERTLKRRLAERGETFSKLLEAERHARAMQLLRVGTLSVEEIADRLGYSDAANFTRAFRRWTGKTPLRSRKRM